MHFLSLIFSDIKPIIDFGWMMTVGLLVSLSVTFTLLPVVLNILSKENINYKDEKIKNYFIFGNICSKKY